MDMLQVRGNKIINPHGQAIRLRGTCIGGWMNMENFINGYPGAVHSLREAFEREIGPAKTAFWFESFLDHFFNEDDVKFIRSLGATAIRIPFNYRHFEDDARPFKYLESGFRRLDRAIRWCARHGLYVILDLHAVQGWQNPDWHSDNASNYAQFWQHPHFQDRFVALWQELARRYKGNPAVAGYNVMNEPVTHRGAFNRNPYTAAPVEPDWKAINRVYRRVVKAIRAIDPAHIIFLEGDDYSRLFSGLDAPFAPNLVYSSHNYMMPGQPAGQYPGRIQGVQWDKARVASEFARCEGFRFAKKHNVPLWVGEFGSIFNGPAREIPDRCRALDDQVAVMDERDVHWTTWTYKDVGVMGWVSPGPASAYMQAIGPSLRAKRRLHAEGWGYLSPAPVEKLVDQMGKMIAAAVADPEQADPRHHWHMKKAFLCTYVAGILQTPFARVFKGMSEARIDKTLASWEVSNCTPDKEQLAVLKKNLAKEKQ